MSDSVLPHRWQPTRLPRPWDSPGKDTGVGCHFLLQCMKVRSESQVSCSVVSSSLRPHRLEPIRLLCPWGFSVLTQCFFFKVFIEVYLIYSVVLASGVQQSGSYIFFLGASLVAYMGKNPPAMRETWVWSLGWEEPLEEGMATHSSVLAWKIPMDRRAWRSTVHGVIKNRAQRSD